MEKNIKKMTVLLMVIMLVMTSLLFTSCSKKKDPTFEEPEVIVDDDTDDQQEEEKKEEEKQPDVIDVVTGSNPLTGLKMNDTAEGKRPVAIMVENSPYARPQWGMDDPNYSPDIILEAEVESGITRTMWLFADYTALPDTIGPIRSARPPYVKFSELFDSIYVHWGQSESLANYIGADDVIKMDGVNNINQMAYKGKTTLFDRNHDRDVALEHTGVLYGKNMAKAIEEYGYRTKLDTKHFSSLEFNDKLEKLSDTACNQLDVKISSVSWIKHWKYDETDHYYHTDDYKNNLTRQNILVLYDTTEYVTKPGASFSYCNYLLAGGEGKLASQGTIKDIKWSIQGGKLVLKDKDGQIVKLNPGKTWIGWISSNYGGNVIVK